MKQPNRLSVLYAEGNEDSGFMLSTLLGFSTIDVLLALSIKEAFQSAQNKHFDHTRDKMRILDRANLDKSRDCVAPSSKPKNRVSALIKLLIY